jgi:hypothetical protein
MVVVHKPWKLLNRNQLLNVKLMKKKVIFILGVVALTTLSFTFSNIERKAGKNENTPTSSVAVDAPAGGFMESSVER